MWLWTTIVISLCGIAAIVVAVRGAGRNRRAANRVAAAESFRTSAEEFSREFCQVAGSLGKPRGLRWKSCDPAGPPLFVVESASRDLVALLPVEIRFEAIEGGDMEDVEAVGNIRIATAVFFRRQDGWLTDGRAVFNHSPEETLSRFVDSLQPWSGVDTGENPH